MTVRSGSAASTTTKRAWLRGYEKHLHHFDDTPDEVFDLSADPFEKHNLADERGKEVVKGWRDNLISWRAQVNAVYDGKSIPA